MKNSITKTLLCGVMASTFFLINCQKAPSRGIKAQAGGSADVVVDNKLAGKVMVECTPDFVDKYKVSADLVTKLTAATQKLDGLDETQKSTLSASAKTAGDSVTAALDAITKIQLDADGCTVTDKTTSKKTPYLKAEIKAQYDKIVLAMHEKANIDVDTYYQSAVDTKKAFDEAKAAKVATAAADVEIKGLKQNMKFIVSDALAAVLKDDNVAGVVYFKQGKIMDKPTTEEQTKDRADLTLSSCEIGSGSGNAEKGEEAVVTSFVNPVTKDATKKRYTLSVVLTIKSVMIKIDCLIADNMSKSVGSAFRLVFGHNLKTQAQIDSEKKKADIAQGILDGKRAAKLELSNTADENVKTAQAAVDAIDKEIAAAVEAKDDTKSTTLNEKRVELVATLEKAKVDQVAAQADLLEATSVQARSAVRN